MTSVEAGFSYILGMSVGLYRKEFLILKKCTRTVRTLFWLERRRELHVDKIVVAAAAVASMKGD